MSLSETATIRSPLNIPPLRLKPTDCEKQPLSLLDLPTELRLEIYSYLLPNIQSYSTGVSEPPAVSQTCLRKHSESADPSIIFTCKQIYREAVPYLYRDHCFNFDIAGHLLRSVANRHNRITTVNFRAWLGLSSFFKQHWPVYDVDNLDFTKLEEICVTFWPVHGCPTRLDDARRVTVAFCKKLQQASRLRKVSIVFRDLWPAPQLVASAMTCRHMTEVEYLLQPFKVLRGVDQVKIDMPVYRTSCDGFDLPFQQPNWGIVSDRTVESQLQCVEEAKAMMVQSAIAVG
ncbi:MAG: hypothetical protein Q9222_007605 [Ikaeria aurantiellina]